MYNAITSGSKIIGTIIADGDIRIDGTVEGEMQCTGKVVIGEKGLIKGTVSCQNAEIMGTLDGKIVNSQTPALRATGKIKGEVQTQTLIVEPNAQFNCSCQMPATQSKPATGKYKRTRKYTEYTLLRENP